MSTRNFLLSLFSFGAVACLPLPASSTDLPKEGTRHVDTQFKGRVDGDKSSTVGADRIEAWDETRVVTLNCGQTQ